MIKHLYTIIILSFIFGGSLIAQDFNVLDEKGRKQGPFKKYYESAKDKVFYIGQFKNDIPYGRFTYYYKNGKVKSFMDYSDEGKIARSEVYSDNGKKLAEGRYVDKEKDSTWVYYNSYGKIQSIENWIGGKKHGVEIIFLASGDTSEVKYWKNDQQHGPWRQYYDNGTYKMKARMVDHEFEGEVTYFFKSGKKNIKGRYVNGFREGTWYHYHEDGSIEMQVLYRNGEVVKEKRENGVFIEWLEPGIPLSEISYKNGMKHGPFTIYHEGAERVITESKDPLTGELIPTERIEGLQAKTIGAYKNDEIHGLVKHYNSAGVLIKEEVFKNGQVVNN